ncbi:MAG: hypothetical protein K8W52_28135 [Deltaproteobacteria bacterium]|nr:hypothetical protein [Deltaproteobacteria bacterium]
MRSIRSGLLALAVIALPLAACVVEDERSATAQFTIWCQVNDGAGAPVNAQYVAFESVKYTYGGEVDESSRITLGEATTSQNVAHPGSAAFEVGYTLHARDDEQEVAEFACAVALPGGGDVQAAVEVDFSNVLMHPTIERELHLQLP